MQACPNAILLAHPRAAPHLIDPGKLVASARKVYGDEAFEQLYGEIGPIHANRVRSMEDGERLSFGARTLTFIHTRGHANHHFCIHDDDSRGVFTGDSFGLAYPALQSRGLFIIPTTSPTDFDPAEARLSIKKILATGAEKAFLTHFGEVHEMKAAAAQLERHLDFSEQLMNEAAASAEPDSELNTFCETRLNAYFRRILEEHGFGGDREAWELLKLDLELNAAGIAHAARKKRARG